MGCLSFATMLRSVVDEVLQTNFSGAASPAPRVRGQQGNLLLDVRGCCFFFLTVVLQYRNIHQYHNIAISQYRNIHQYHNIAISPHVEIRISHRH